MLVLAVILLPVTAMALRLAGLRRSQRMFSFFLLNNPVRKTKQSEATIARALHISRLVGVAVRHGVCGANCLQRSLSLWWILRRNGIYSELYIGTRKEIGLLNAHAWIEVEGVVLNDSNDVRHSYEPFDREISAQFTGS
jgi:Transglutaminase-like superfamily